MPTVIWELFRARREKTALESHSGAGRLFVTTLWFGLLAGWLELGLVQAQRAVNPHVSIDMLRTNRHFIWMVPVSDVSIFSVVAVVIALTARFRMGIARWIVLRLPVAMTFLTLLLSIEGLWPIASVILACGLAASFGPRLARLASASGRFVPVSFAVMALSLAVLTGLNYKWVSTAEERALGARPLIHTKVPKLPNVLLLVLDTVRAASVSLHGYHRPTTPNLERLASKALIFSEARSTASWTLPSHASIMTGRWPHELSVGPDLPLDRTFPTLAETLAKEGYATAGFVANTVYCNSLYGVGRGFARYEDAYENQTVSLFETVRSSGLGKRVIRALGYPISYADGDTSDRKTAAMLNRDVLRWLDGRPSGEPFFAFINYLDAHNPYVFHDHPNPRFGTAALPSVEHSEIDRRFWDLARGKPTPAGYTPEQIINEGYTLFQDSYESCISYLDRQIGVLVHELERRGLLENTLMIVTADHGEQFGEHGLFGHGVSLYRREIHVPLLIITPTRLSRAKAVDEPVSLREVPVTVAEWAQLGPRNPFPGRSLTRFLADAASGIAEPSPVLSEVQHMEVLPRTPHIPTTQGEVRSLVSRNRVYIHNESGREELYDLSHDDLEVIDLSKYPESRSDIVRLREELSRFDHGLTARNR
jgi:arylsulfatase A-like enzyme